MRLVKVAAVAFAVTLAGAAHAQEGGAPPPMGPAPSLGVDVEMRGPDDRLTDLARLNNDVAGRRGIPRSSRPVPALPEDVTTGSEVRDSKGVVIGTVHTVGMGFAVVSSPAGKVEVELASFAKNNKGLLINMPKTKFDAIVAGSSKPAN